MTPLWDLPVPFVCSLALCSLSGEAIQTSLAFVKDITLAKEYWSLELVAAEMSICNRHVCYLHSAPERAPTFPRGLNT